MTDDERAVWVEVAARALCRKWAEQNPYLRADEVDAEVDQNWRFFINGEFGHAHTIQTVIAAIEPAIRADERARAEAEVERLRAALREALAFIAGVNSGCTPLVARIVTALATEDKP